jgi:hypothetical protein
MAITTEDFDEGLLDFWRARGGACARLWRGLRLRLGGALAGGAPWRRSGWRRLLASSPALREAAVADPRLYERCHAPYVSRRFPRRARYRIVEAHYRFLAERFFPARLRRKLLKGHDVRVATLRLRHGEAAYLHLRRPGLGLAGELGLFLLAGDKRVLSSCTITFGGAEGVLIGAMQGSWAFMGRQPIRAFTRAAHGLRPKDLLLSLVQALAVFYGFERLRAVGNAAHPLAGTGLVRADYDAFWRERGGWLGADGCWVLPLVRPSRDPATVASKRRAARRRREQFREEACAAFLKAFRWPSPPSRVTAAGRPLEVVAAAEHGRAALADRHEGLVEVQRVEGAGEQVAHAQGEPPVGGVVGDVQLGAGLAGHGEVGPAVAAAAEAAALRHDAGAHAPGLQRRPLEAIAGPGAE